MVSDEEKRMTGVLAGKVAVVTGGATGLGAAIVALYAGAGARVVVGDIRPQEAEAVAASARAAGGDVDVVDVDVSRGADVARLIEHAERRHGRIDVVTSNAGILGRGHKQSIVDVSDDELRQVMDVNFGGAWNVLRHAIPALRRAGGGAITVTGSTGSERGIPKAPAYAASKGAIAALVRAVAVDVAPEIRVNAVLPGAMATRIAVHAAQEKGIAADEVVAQAHDVEFADPLECAQTHLFLASPAAAGINGQLVTVDRGLSVRHP
jgi:3-oxoacyl-[acyl-carrier protein] reductase